MEKRVKVPSSQLQLGMCVVDLDRPWLETPFLFQGFYLQTQEDIRTVQEYCRYVIIDANRSPRTLGQKSAAKPVENKGFFGLFTKQEAPPVQVATEKELRAAKQAHSKSSAIVRNFMDDVRLGRALNVKAIEDSVTDTVDSVLRNPDAMMWLAQLKQKDKLQEQHCINVCILTIAFGRHLGLPREELQKLGICALLHDVGKVQVPDPLLFKKETLTDNEWQVLRKHAEFGRVILMAAKGIYPGSIDVVMTHHERIDGKGYPRGLVGSQIAPFARMIAICDTYDDIVTEHPYREEHTPFEAMKALNDGRGSQFDETLVKHFIDMVGVFPIGSILELNTGEVGIVVANTPKNPMQPRLLIVLDSQKKTCRETAMNLATINIGRDTTPIRVARILRKGDYQIDPQTLQQRAMMFCENQS